MKIFNVRNTHHTVAHGILTSHMLIGSRNVKGTKISMQISFIPVNSEQPIHNHEPEQCYYIIRGKGLMVIENDREPVGPGDAIFIPSNKQHGIKNIGTEVLEYLTVNAPAFNEVYEQKLWPDK